MHHQRPSPASSIHPKADLKAAASVQFKPLWRKQQEANKDQIKDNDIRIGQRKSMQLLLVEYSVHPSKIFKQEANDTIKVAGQIFSKSKNNLQAATRRQGNFINHRRRQIQASIGRSNPQP
ncbi:hypothetical protein Droror1_Dr00026272 [Drosera rotundifolia]